MASFRQRNKTALNDSAGSPLAGQSVVQATGVTYSENKTPKGDFFSIGVDVSGVSSETLDVAVEISSDSATTWGAMEADIGTISTAAAAALAQWTADGYKHGYWRNPCSGGSPADLIRFSFTAGSGDTVVLDSVYYAEGSLGGL